MTTTLSPGPHEIAERIDAAADLIERHGLAQEDWWPQASVFTYQAGWPVCVVGALAVACGYSDSRQVTGEFLGDVEVVLDEHDDTVDIIVPEHAALTALRTELRKQLRLDSLSALYDWSDTSTPEVVVPRLRQVAAAIRSTGAGR